MNNAFSGRPGHGLLRSSLQYSRSTSFRRAATMDIRSENFWSAKSKVLSCKSLCNRKLLSASLIIIIMRTLILSFTIISLLLCLFNGPRIIKLISAVTTASISKWVWVRSLCEEYQLLSILKVEKITITKRLILDTIWKRDWGELGRVNFVSCQNWSWVEHRYRNHFMCWPGDSFVTIHKPHCTKTIFKKVKKTHRWKFLGM